jgi:hypothetical protein
VLLFDAPLEDIAFVPGSPTRLVVTDEFAQSFTYDVQM